MMKTRKIINRNSVDEVLITIKDQSMLAECIYIKTNDRQELFTLGGEFFPKSIEKYADFIEQNILTIINEKSFFSIEKIKISVEERVLALIKKDEDYENKE